MVSLAGMCYYHQESMESRTTVAQCAWIRACDAAIAYFSGWNECLYIYLEQWPQVDQAIWEENMEHLRCIYEIK